MLDETNSRVAMMIARGLVAMTDDDKKMQRHQVRLLSNETKDNIEHFQPYGFTSVPKGGAETVVVFLGGNLSRGIAIVTDDRRAGLTGVLPGEVGRSTHEG